MRQGDEEMEQYFILDGMLKRVVSNPQGRDDPALRRRAERWTPHAAWRLRTPVPYSIGAVTKVRIAELPHAAMGEFLERHPELSRRIRVRGDELMTEVMAHTITLHLLDAPGRVALRAQAPGAGRAHAEEGLAAYLNLSPETLSG